MKGIRIFLVLIVFSLVLLGDAIGVKAQCATCASAVESNNKSGSTITNGLNGGILYLLAAPYLIAGAAGYIWYKKYRRKNIEMNIRYDKLNLN